MKLNLIHDPSKKISNYINIDINNSNQIENIVNNSCEEILCIDSLDYVNNDEGYKILGSILSKLRINGVLTISGTDSRSLSRLFLSEQISNKEYNQEIENKKSFRTSSEIKKIIKSFDLTIELENIRGQKYEFSARRK